MDLLSGFDKTVHLGDVMMTAALGAVGYGLRQFYTKIAGFIDRVDEQEHRSEDANQVIDEHSLVILRSKLGGPLDYPRLTRRRSDRMRSEDLIIPPQ